MDSLTGTWLCSVPEECFGGSYEAWSIALDNLTDITIDGENATNGYTFNNLNGTRTWSVKGTTPQGKTVQHNLQFTFLPIVVINGTVDKDAYNTGTVSVLLPDEDIVSPCKVKFRGSATNSHVYFKRNYHLKFVNEQGEKEDYKFFEGLRNDNNWLLDGGTLDRLRVRNRVLTDLWADIVSKPYYAEQEPKALTASRGKMVELFRNGEYFGIYNMCEAMDRKQLKLKKMNEETGEVFGQLWKSGQRSNTTKMMTCPVPNNFMDTWDGFEVNYPELSDVNPTDYSTLYNAVKFVAESSDEEFAAHAREYLDVDPLIDIFIYMQFLLAYDNLGKNYYWATYDRTQGPMITPVMWDFDTSLGQSWKNYEYHPTYLHPEQDVYTFYTSNVDLYIKRFVKWNVDGFVDKAKERYWQLRKGVLATDSINDRFTACIDMLKKSGGAQREERRWVRCSDLGGRSVDLTGELNFVTDWVTKRMKWLDNYFGEHPAGDTNYDNEVDISDANFTISAILNKSGANDIYAGRSDLNGDRVVDINDYNNLANKILRK